MWTCQKCGTKVDPSFEVCWNCGTSVDGREDPTFVAADAEALGPETSPTEIEMPEGDRPIPASKNPEDDQLVEAYQALDLMQAKFLADRLSEEGIPAMSDLHDLHESLGGLSSAPRVWVRAADLAKAREWLERFEAISRESS